MDIHPVKRTDPPEEPEHVSFRSVHFRSTGSLKERVLIGVILAGGIAVGTLLFLFFITLFVYVFLPLAAFFLIWQVVRSFMRRG